VEAIHSEEEGRTEEVEEEEEEVVVVVINVVDTTDGMITNRSEVRIETSMTTDVDEETPTFLHEVDEAIIFKASLIEVALLMHQVVTKTWTQIRTTRDRIDKSRTTTSGSHHHYRRTLYLLFNYLRLHFGHQCFQTPIYPFPLLLHHLLHHKYPILI